MQYNYQVKAGKPYPTIHRRIFHTESKFQYQIKQQQTQEANFLMISFQIPKIHKKKIWTPIRRKGSGRPIQPLPFCHWNHMLNQKKSKYINFFSYLKHIFNSYLAYKNLNDDNYGHDFCENPPSGIHRSLHHR